MDGEGTVTMFVKSRETRSPAVEMSSTTFELLDFLRTNYGGTICNHKTYKAHHKQSWSWKVRNNAALDFLSKVAPYMREPEKARRAHLLLSDYKSVTKRNGKYTSSELEAKKDFVLRFFHPSTP